MNNDFMSPYRLLMNKDIYSILDGDKQFENYEISDDGSVIQISMPYLTGSDLCKLCNRFAVPILSSGGNQKLSRWQYLEILFEHSISRNNCSDVLTYIFGKQQFSTMFSGYDPNTIDTAYKYFVKAIIEKINGILYFGDHELAFINNKNIIREIGTNVEIQAPKIKEIDREYIRSISTRAIADVDQHNFDSAITKSRTLLEEVFCYVIEKKGEEPSSNGSIGDLYKQVKNLYNMHADANTDKRINNLLSGLEKIVSSISEMRNRDSDAHGVGSSRINIEEHHARLFVNAAIAMADFILSVEIKVMGK